MFLVWFCSCLCPVNWSHVLSREWRYSWSSADWRSEWSKTILLPTKMRLILEVMFASTSRPSKPDLVAHIYCTQNKSTIDIGVYEILLRYMVCVIHCWCEHYIYVFGKLWVQKQSIKTRSTEGKIINIYCSPHVSQSNGFLHCSDGIMSAMATQIAGVSIVCAAVCSGADQRKHQSSASLAFVRGIHRWPMDSPYKGPVTRKIFPFDDVIMTYSFI